MKLEINITKTGEILDTFPGDDKISLNYQLSDIKDISKKKTNFSKTITLPGTPNNNLFFKQQFDVNIDNNRFNPIKSISATFTIGVNEVFAGSIQLLNILNNNGSVEYVIQALGKLKSILTALEGKSINALDFERFNHERNKSSIEASWNNAQGYVYPYINRGGNNDINTEMLLGDMYPSLFLKDIFDQMFQEAGYTYTSQFFESEYFKKLIIPFAGDVFKKTTQQIEEERVNIGVDGVSVHVVGPVQNNINDFSTTLAVPMLKETGTLGNQTFKDIFNTITPYGYIAQKSDYYKVGFDAGYYLEFDRNGGTKTNFEWNGNGHIEVRTRVIKVDGAGIETIEADQTTTVQPSDTGDHTTLPWADSAGSFNINISVPNVHLNIGDKIYITHTMGESSMQMVGVGNVGDEHVTTELYMKDINDSVASHWSVESNNNTVNPITFINFEYLYDASLTQTDLFLDILKMFNMVLQDDPNNTKNLLIDTASNFYNSKSSTKDWTGKVDRSSVIDIQPMSEVDFTKYEYTYSEDSDYFNTEYTEEHGNVYGNVYGSLSFNINNDFSDKTSTTKLAFAPSPMSDTFTPDIGPVVFFGKWDDPNLKKSNVKNRILFYGGLVDNSANTQWALKSNSSDLSPTYHSHYPYAGMLDHPYQSKFDLSFGKPSSRYMSDTTLTYTNNTLYEMFHKRTLLNIVDVNSKLMTCSLYLTNEDIHNFDFRDTIFVDGSYWRVNLIKDFNPNVESLTVVEFYKIIDPSFKKINTLEVGILVENSCPIDIAPVKFTANGYTGFYESTDIIDEACCDSLGGIYDGGTCYVAYATDTGDDGVDIALPPDKLISDTTITGSKSSPDSYNYGDISPEPGVIKVKSVVTESVTITNELNLTNVTVIGDDAIVLPVDLLYSELVTLRDGGLLEPGRVYNMTDKRIRLTALDVDKLSLEGSRIMTLPLSGLYAPHTQALGGGITGNFLGIYGQTIAQGSVPVSTYTFNTGQVYYAIWGGKLWLRDTSGVDVGAQLQGAITGTGWTQVTTGAYVEDKTFFVNYDFDNGYVSLQTDWKGNIISTPINNYIESTGITYLKVLTGNPDWDTPTNWTPIGIPGAGDGVIITENVTVPSTGASINNITVTGSTLTLNGLLSVNSNLDLTNTTTVNPENIIRTHYNNGCNITDWNDYRIYNNDSYGIYNNIFPNVVGLGGQLLTTIRDNNIPGEIYNNDAYYIYGNTSIGSIYDNVCGANAGIVHNINPGPISGNVTTIAGSTLYDSVGIGYNKNNGPIINNACHAIWFNTNNGYIANFVGNSVITDTVVNK